MIPHSTMRKKARLAATPNKQPAQLIEVARLELRKRNLLRQSAEVERKSHSLDIEIPWVPHR
jgi:hypothetical protein